MRTLFILASVLLGVALATYDPYMNLDMDKLYRMQLLANAINDYMPNEQQLVSDETGLEDEVPYSYWPEFEDMVQTQPEEVDPEEQVQEVKDDQAIYNDPLYSGAHLRDQEHLEHSNLHGYQSMTGGTAEGSHDEKQVKSDKLPAYCNPPNPCPVGKTAAENCVENFENTAENNERLLSQQECSCDTEHMFKCPVGSKTVTTKAEGEAGRQQMALNKVMGELAKMEEQGQSLENNAHLSSTRKRVTLVAKKSPHFIRKRSESPDYNPYHQGKRIGIASKKSHKDAIQAYPQHYKFNLD